MVADPFSIQFEPLLHWPQPDTNPRQGPRFRTSYDRTLRDLRVELRALDVTGPVAIQVVTRNGRTDLRRDGMLMARAQVIHPGVRISFRSRHGDLTYASDTFESPYYRSSPDWQDNLRAIVLGLEALRAVDRYGISGSGEQYRGWQQIAARTGSGSGMSDAIALAVLAEEAGLSEDDVLRDTRVAVRLAKRNAHPDANDGRSTRWNALRQALNALGVED